MSREYLVMTPEGNIATPGNWGTYQSGNTHTVIQLTDSNQFTVRPFVVPWELRSAGGYNRKIQRGSSKSAVQGSLNNLVLYGTQASFWVTALTPAIPTGGSEYDLPSYSIDHVVYAENSTNTSITHRYLGCKITRASFTGDSDAQLLRLSTNISGKSYSTFTAADPSATSYAYDPPFVLEGITTMTFGSTGARVTSGFDKFSIDIESLVDTPFFNSTGYLYIKYCGRNVGGTVMFPLLTNADRADFEAAGTPNTATAVFVAGVTPNAYTLTFTFHGQNFTSAIADSLDYNRLFTQTITYENFFDSTVPGDLTITSSGPA